MTVRPLMVQEQAAKFATTREQAEARAANIRRHGHSVAIEHLVRGNPGHALAVVLRTYQQQALALGLHLHQTDSGVTW